ncbi:metal-sulfur cluster assembly factor [Halococcus dombrowskii]|uniref:Metal-sulfur cluster assembly factor n=1 Tax=Halococcus dombrowskii TaxID=179637 RepID=A0AAV3SET8_HALDO|nr:1,2-phenylacetyl-CoA epoxidase subunit PaaD [Halococcus dombrowskii]UOO94608.1 metal-sulfur cluster assembly factor [Halococcus dombrowskii]
MSSESGIDPEFDPDANYCAYTDYESGEAVEELPATGEGSAGVERAVWDALYDIDDPEMPISIVDLGLIYGVVIEDGHARVDMTLTYTGCPARDMLQETVRKRVAAVESVDEAELRLVWSPEWTVEMVTERGKEDLREFGLSI